MLIGHPDRFAIESHITRAYARPGFLALGYFVLHVGGRRSKLAEIIEARNLKWCDPDEAFDDGTTLFHFDGATIPRPFATCGWMRMNFIGCFKNGGTPFSQNGAEQTKYP